MKTDITQIIEQLIPMFPDVAFEVWSVRNAKVSPYIGVQLNSVGFEFRKVNQSNPNLTAIGEATYNFSLTCVANNLDDLIKLHNYFCTALNRVNKYYPVVFETCSFPNANAGAIQQLFELNGGFSVSVPMNEMDSPDLTFAAGRSVGASDTTIPKHIITHIQVEKEQI